ncbi:MAG: glutathione synthase [Pseudomonadota bacterium]|nr:glutathione synthase [Pseudomonadota bacterium]
MSTAPAKAKKQHRPKDAAKASGVRKAASPRKPAKGEAIKLGFVINDMATEQDNYTTIRLARVAINRGHEVALIGLGGFIYDADGTIRAMANVPRKSSYQDDADLLADLQADDADIHRISVDALDVLMLRSDPADEVEGRPWAPNSGLLFAQLAVLKHVIVLNDPGHLTDASNKTYFQHFPEEVRPVTCITLEADEIRAFIAAHDGYGVIKPLQGSGGQSVFVVTPESEGNLNQMIDAVTRDGYAIVQEYLPKAVDGDLRLITLNGRPLCVDGVYACVRRYNDSGDARSNISAGGKTTMAQPDADALRLAEIVAPKLIRDGMYLAGLDIVGDKLMEINVDTPGGINMIEDTTGVDFSSHIVADLERKVRLREQYNRTLSNTELAIM